MVCIAVKCQQEQDQLRETIADKNIRIESLEIQLGVYDSSNDSNAKEDSDPCYSESETEVPIVSRRVETRSLRNRLDAKQAITKTEWKRRMMVRFKKTQGK